MTTGTDLRDHGQESVIAADTAAHRGYGDLIHQAMDELITADVPFSAEDVRDIVTRDHPTAVAHSPNLIGAVMAGYAKRGVITEVGFTRPRRATRRHSRLLVWQANHETRAA